MAKASFDNLMLIGRAGSGKSELIDFLKSLKDDDRLSKYNVGLIEEIDDFPWLFSLFKDEDIWEALGRPRTLSKKIGHIYDTVDYDLYDFTSLKFNLEVKKRISSEEHFYEKKTLFIEYARGRSDGYKRTLNLFSPELLKNTAIFYMDNTFEESMRRNTIRSSESDEDQTILKHKTPLNVMEYYYKDHDWYDLTDKKPSGYLKIHGINVPFVTVWNIPESHDLNVLETRYSTSLKTLWKLYSER